ncbi:GTPase [Streptomyces sp. NPDC050560]|uniref:GTPase n=1 Tax=Streptomyces sp. NPDC050560 TaxID=3365630 RepID=UPI00378A11E8
MTEVTAVTDPAEPTDQQATGASPGAGPHTGAAADPPGPRADLQQPPTARASRTPPEAAGTRAEDDRQDSGNSSASATPAPGTGQGHKDAPGANGAAQDSDVTNPSAAAASAAAGDGGTPAGHARVEADRRYTRVGGPTPPGVRRAEPPADTAGRGGAVDVWDDGLIARRAFDSPAPGGPNPVYGAHDTEQQGHPLYDNGLRGRLEALRELVGLSRARLDSGDLARATRVLDEAGARQALSGRHTVVALAGATGSGKSSLFNALAGTHVSDTGVRRPTTSFPVACSWSDGGEPLLDRLGIPGRLRRRPLPGHDGSLNGLILVDLPDHDSAMAAHRDQVDRVLALVDAVIWVVDPEKYADAVLHDRYLRPLAGHAEVMFVVLNQIDRLPGDAADQVLDDLRRLLDEDGVALGEYEEPGATVLAASAATGSGVGELREALGQFVAERGAPARRIAADIDTAAAGLKTVYATARRPGLGEDAREEFTDRLAESIGAAAAGEAAERAWRRHAGKACGTPWLRLWRWHRARRAPQSGAVACAPASEETTARARVEQAVRTVADQAASGLPAPWGQAVREAAVRGSRGLPEALDELAVTVGAPEDRPPRPGWWPAAVLVQASMTLLQILGGLWLVGQIVGVCPPNLGVAVLLMAIGIVGGPCVEWICRLSARGPARRYGLEAERRLREAAAACGRAKVLDPVAAELLRYAEVREQYVRVRGDTAVGARLG